MNHWCSVDAHFTHSLTINVSSIIVVQTYIEIIDSQWFFSTYYFLHPNDLSPLAIWFTTSCVTWGINDVPTSRSSAFGRQWAACRPGHWFLINSAWLSHHSWSSSFSSISMTYHKQFSKSRPCWPGLSSELCIWMHGWMQHDGCHAYRFVLRFDRCFYDSYDITYLKVVGKFRHYFSFYFRT